MRYKFDRDDSGHWYMIPADLADEFLEYCENYENNELYEKFSRLRCEYPCFYTFTDPQEDF